jgi:hypothetical protein
MKAEHNLMVAIFCYGILLFHFIEHKMILNHPYMVVLMLTLFAVGGWNFGRGIGKIINK